MPKFRKKPVVIEAVQFTGLARDADELRAFVGDYSMGLPASLSPGDCYWYDAGFFVHTLEGDMHAMPGDWLIRGVAGELYPCKPEIFDATYEAVTE